MESKKFKNVYNMSRWKLFEMVGGVAGVTAMAATGVGIGASNNSVIEYDGDFQ